MTLGELVSKGFHAIPKNLWIAIITIGGGLVGSALAWDTQVYPFIKKWFIEAPISNYLAYALALAVLAAITGYMLYFLKWREMRRYRACERTFGTIANDNAKVDLEIFDLLFSEISATIENNAQAIYELIEQRDLVLIKGKIEHARGLIHSHNWRITHLTASIVESHCGRPCVAVVKLYNGSSVPSADGRQLQQLEPHYWSNDIQRPTKVIQLTDETPFAEIQAGTASCFMAKDIGKVPKYRALDCPECKEYKSIVVVPINDPALPTSRLGYLQVDSKDGDVATDSCRHYAQQLAWRLAVMTKRFTALEGQIKAFDALEEKHEEARKRDEELRRLGEQVRSQKRAAKRNQEPPSEPQEH